MKVLQSIEKLISKLEDKLGKHLNDTFLIIALVGFSLAFFTYQLGKESLWLDEIYTYFASNTFSNLVATIVTKERNMWLYHILMYFWKFIGPGEFIMRLLSVLLAVIGVLGMYKLGKYVHSRLLGFIAALVLLMNSFYIEYAQEARAYSLFATFFVLTTLYMLRYVEGRNVKDAVVYVILAVLSVYTHLFSFIFIAIQALFILWYSYKSKKFLQVWVLTFSSITLGMLPLFFSYFHSNTGSISKQSKGILSWIPSPNFGTVYSQYYAFSSSSQVLMNLYFALLVFLIVSLINHKQVFEKKMKFIAYLFVVSFIPIISAIQFSIYFKPLYVDRYFIFALPAFILLIAIALINIRSKILMIVVLLAIVALNINVSRYYYNQPRKEQWRLVLEYIDKKIKTNEKLVLYPESMYLPFSYYKNSAIPSVQSNDVIVSFPKELKYESDEYNIKQLQRELGSPKGVWVVTRKQNLPELRFTQMATIEAVLSEKYANETTNEDFKALKILHFTEPK